MIISPELAVRAVLEYNAGSYRGRRNIDIDREAYARFAGGVPEYEDTLIALLAFAADDYGGAQGRFLPHGYRDEAASIAVTLRPRLPTDLPAPSAFTLSTRNREDQKVISNWPFASVNAAPPPELTTAIPENVPTMRLAVRLLIVTVPPPPWNAVPQPAPVPDPITPDQALHGTR